MNRPLYWKENVGLQGLTAYQDKYSNAMQSMQYLNPISLDSSQPLNVTKNNSSMDFGIGASVGSLIDAGAQIGGMVLQNHYQKQAEQRANEEWERRFNLENEYNAPSAQAERLRSAGINPLAQMSGSAPTPSSSGSTNNAQGPSQQIDTNFASVALSMQELELREKELQIMEKKTDADIRNLDADTEGKLGVEGRAKDMYPLLKQAQALANEGKISRNVIDAVEAMYSDEHWRYTLDQQAAAISRVLWQNLESSQNIESMKMGMFEAASRIALNNSGIALNDSLISKNQSDIKVNEAEIRKIAKEINHMTIEEAQRWFEARTGRRIADAQVKEVQSKCQVYEAEAEKIEKESKYVGFRQITGGIKDLATATADVVSAFKPFPEIQNSIVVSSPVGSTSQTGLNGPIFDGYGNIRK